MNTMVQIHQHRVQKRVPITILEINGNIDASTSEEFLKQACLEIEDGANYMLLDLSQVAYISSAGLRAIYQLLDELSSRNGSSLTGELHGNTFKSPYLKLFNPLPAIVKTFQMVGMDMLLDIHNNLDQAVESFSSEQ